MEFIIDRSKWRCGCYGVYQKGTGETQLLNANGYMCCLGQVCSQLGIADENILDKYEPRDIGKDFYEEINILVSLTGFHKTHTRLCNKAMSINDNDDENFCSVDREEKLTELFKEFGHTIKFIGKYNELS